MIDNVSQRTVNSVGAFSIDVIDRDTIALRVTVGPLTSVIVIPVSDVPNIQAAMQKAVQIALTKLITPKPEHS